MPSDSDHECGFECEGYDSEYERSDLECEGSAPVPPGIDTSVISGSPSLSPISSVMLLSPSILSPLSCLSSPAVSPPQFSPTTSPDSVSASASQGLCTHSSTPPIPVVSHVLPSPLSSPTESPLGLSLPSTSSSPASPLALQSSASCSYSGIDVATIDDIGVLLNSMPQTVIRNLAPEQKYSLLINHFKPSIRYKFPSQYADGCNRSCQYQYFIDNPWFAYSKMEDGIFCLPCVLFASKDDLGQFVCQKFNTWSKKTRKFAEHNSNKYHKLALVRTEALKSSISQPRTSIDNRLKQISSSAIGKNRYVIKCLADTILMCGQQSIALRGHRDDGTADSCNKGNFLAILSYGIRSGNVALEKHLKEAPKNAIYTSKTIQNDLIDCIGDHIRAKIIGEVKGAKWYSILCDEATDHSNKEQVSVVLRFVDGNCNIKEEFLDFVGTKRITGEVLARKLKETLVKYDVDFQDCRGQGYDGAANMSSSGAGVQGRLLADNPKAVYIHCNSHILNLCIVQACSLPAIRNMNATVTESAAFFENSSKRQGFFEDVIDRRTSTVKVKDLCRTRWAYRHSAYENFFKLYKYLVATMKAIVSRNSQYGEMNWDGKTLVAATGLLTMYRTFSFILSFVAAMNVMAIIKPISIKLQFRYYDIVKAYSQVKSVIDELNALRGSDGMLHAWYVQAEDLAREVDVTPRAPRTAGRQSHRDNTEHNTAEEYYRRCTVLPLLDNFIQQMNERFSSTQVIAAKLLDLVPSSICTHSESQVSLAEVTSFYDSDLPNSAVVTTEAWRWRTKWLAEDAGSRPSTLRTALKACDKDYFPNIYTLLRIGCTIPVTSCENERAHSTLKNIKTVLRSTMGQERLSSLAVMSIHADKPVDFDDVIDRFKLKGNRRIAL